MAKPVLIVEDDLDVRESLQLALEAYGYSVATAANGRAALDLLKQGLEPCVILLDVMMPVMNGWEFLDAKLADPALKDIPTYLLSAADRQHLATEKAQGFLAKPINMEKLLAILAGHCGT